VLAVAAAVRDAAEQGDPAAYRAALADDAAILRPNEAPHRGAGLAAFLESFLGSYRVRWLSFTSTELVTFEDYAYHAYAYVRELAPRKGGAARIERGSGVQILRPGPDGSWRIARELWSEATPPESASRRREPDRFHGR
jgi:ketosteroid isomerase-like protein